MARGKIIVLSHELALLLGMERYLVAVLIAFPSG